MNEIGDNLFKEIDGNLSSAILDQLPTPVMAVNRDFELTYMNASGCRFVGRDLEEIRGKHCYSLFDSEHCNTANCHMKKVMNGDQPLLVRNRLNMKGRQIPIEYMADSLKDEKGEIVGGLEYILDISEKVRQEEKLREQSRTIMEISTPVIKLWDRILMLPVVGVIDSLRAQQMMDKMLIEIKNTSSKVIILDIQGVAAVDTAVANHLIKIAKATRLMGCKCVLSGISPAVAQTLVQLGIDLGTINTKSNLQEALSDAFSLLEYRISGK